MHRLQDGDYQTARELFARADAAHHAPAIVYNLAVAEEHLFHPHAAIEAYELYVAEAGDQGEFTSAARAAIGQIKARSTRLRISTDPAGARVVVDGFALKTPSPVSFFVPGGRHIVVAEADGFRGETSVDAAGSGDTLAIAILPAAGSKTSAPPTTAKLDDAPRAAPKPVPDGFVWGAAFALVPYHLFGSSSGNNQRDATQLMTGAVLEAGSAVTDRFEILGRAFVGIGPEAKPSTGAPFTYAYMLGPGVSFRLGRSIWLGATFLAGRIETVAHDAAYGTDLVFGAMAEAGVVLFATNAGEYVLSLEPGTLFASSADNTALFVPVTFGYRAF